MSEAEEYLNTIRRLDARLRVKEHERKRLEDDICSLSAIDYSNSHVAGGRPLDISDKIARLDDIIRRANEEWDSFIDRRDEAASLIEQIENPDQRDVLMGYYVWCFGWADVMADIGVGKTKLFELKRDAMSHFEVIYEKNAAILRRERKSKRNDN
ncbi:DUF1492 domain-containing protein [Megasphaera sp.]|uniref:DUF1492 domain-containing protein n=1 Tax=Megasphaera sp. TaxID=2023260 RepID=UPI004028A531